MMMIGMMLEMLGIGLILPVITIVSDPDMIGNYPILSELLQKLGSPSKTELMIGAMILLVFIYSIKNIYLALLAWKQSKFVYSTQAEMAKLLFRGYINQPYTFHLQSNSADLINNLQVELNLFMNYMLNPSMLLLAESLVVLGLVGLLLYFEPVGLLSVLTLFLVVGGLFQWLTKKRIIHWGKLRQHHEALRMKHAQQGISAIKDVKVYGTEDFFISEYEKNTEQSLSMHQKNSFVQNITRLWLEILAISGLLLLCFGMFLQDKTVIEILPVLGLFAAVSFRLMPSISRIVSAINLLRFGTSITEVIASEFKQLEQIESHQVVTKMSFESDIKFSDVSFKYPSSHRSALRNVDISVQKGEMVGFIGPSGAGKSTLIDILMGLLQPDEGCLKVDNKPIDLDNLKGWQRLIGYVPQTIYLTDDTIKRNIAFGIDDNDINEHAVSQAIKAAQLQAFVDELPDGMNTVLGERGVRMSGGQRQRIGIARALYHDPEVLVLDEATSALDTETESGIMDAVVRLQGQKTIFIIAHRLSTLERVDKLFSVERGLVSRST